MLQLLSGTLSGIRKEVPELIKRTKDRINKVLTDQIGEVGKSIWENLGSFDDKEYRLALFPISYSMLAKDFAASNQSLIDANLDLSWVPDSYEEFCDCLRPSKPTFGYVEYTPFDYQIAVAEAIDESETKTVNIYKSRQTGMSEFLISYILFKFLTCAKYRKSYTVIVYSITQKTATELGERMEIMYADCAAGYYKESTLFGRTMYYKGPEFEKNSIQAKSMRDGTVKIRFLAVSGGRGTPGVDLVVVDESDWISDIDKILKSAKPTLGASGGKIVTVTTPNGETGYAYKELTNIGAPEFARAIEEVKQPSHKGWKRISTPDGTNNGFIIHYSAHPHYGENWAKDMRVKLNFDDATWDQEYELATITSGSLFFSLPDAKKSAGLTPSPRVQDYYDIKAALDVATVPGRDFCCLSIWGHRRTDGKYCLIDEYYNNANEQPEHIFNVTRLCKKYQISELVVESNGPGHAMAQHLSRELLGMCEVITQNMSESHKAAITNTMRGMIGTQDVTFSLNSNFMDEIPYFIQTFDDKGKMKRGARPHFHDDAIIAACHCLHRLITGKSRIMMTSL